MCAIEILIHAWIFWFSLVAWKSESKIFEIFFSGLPRLKPLQKKNHLCGRPWNLWKTECLNSLTLRMMGKKSVSLLMDLIPFDCQISLTLIIKYPLNWFDKSLICYRIRTHVVKFMEGVILTLSRKTSVWCEITCIYWMLSLSTFLTLRNYIIRLIYSGKRLWKYVLFFYV